MDDPLASDSSPLSALLFSANAAGPDATTLVWIAAALALLLVYGPLLVRLVRLVLLDRAVREACQLDDRPAEAHREEIATAFARSPLEAQWDDFAYRWRASLAEGERERAPVRLLDVFDERPLVPTGALKSLLPAVPGLFLAIGVLGTFVGLAAAVGAGGADDPAAVAAGVSGALRASLWGLMFAIAAVVGGRLLEGWFDRLAESLDHSVERAFGAVSSGELATLSARAQRDALGQLGGELKRFGSDLTERLDRGLQRIEHSTASAANLVSEEQRNVLQSVVRELSVQVQTGVEQHLAALHDVLARAVDHQGAVTGGLAEAFDQMAENAQVHARVTETLEQAALSVQDAAASMSSTAHDLTPVLEHLRDTGTSLSGTATTMNETQEVVARSADGIRDSIEHATAALVEQRQFIENGLGEIRTTLELMSTGLGENLERALRNVDESLEHTVGRLRETIDDSNETIDRLSGPVRSAEGMTREMHSALERVRNEIVALGEWLGQAVKPLRTTLTQLEDQAGDITRALLQFGDRAQHVDKTMDALRGEIHEEGRRFRSSTSELARHLQRAADVVDATQSRGGRAAAGEPIPSTPSSPRARGPERRTDEGRTTGGGGGSAAPDAPPPAGGGRATAPEQSAADSGTPDAGGTAAAEPGAGSSGSPPQAVAGVSPAPSADGAPDIRAAAADPAAEGAAPDAPTAGAPRPLPIRVHAPRATGSPRATSVAPAAGAAAASAGMDPGEQVRPAAAPPPSPVATISGSGRILGPDPYSRGAGSRDSLERQQRILASGRSMHHLETDDSDADAEESTDDELALSGLLSKHRRPAAARMGRGGGDAPTDGAEQSGRSEDGARPRTWKLLGKE